MSFEVNEGQADQSVKFLARGRGYTLILHPTEAVLLLSRAPIGDSQVKASPHADAGRRHGQFTHREESLQSLLRMSLAGANPAPQVDGCEKLPGIVNYLLGDDPKGWRTWIETCARVRYREVYPGVDLIFYGNQRQLEYDFVVSPGTNPDRIALNFQGASKLEIDDQGNLIVHLSGGFVRWLKPLAYQEVDKAKREIPSRYVVKNDNQIGFEIAAYDANLPLVIDPILIYSTFLGGSDFDAIKGMAIDAGRNVYVTGETYSTNFPTLNAYRSTSYGLRDVFVSKLNSNGTALVYSTYLGGSGDDYSHGIAVDSSGNVYVTGQTASSNFPRQNEYQSSNAGAYEGFLSKLGPTGSTLLYSTYFGGPSDDGGNGVAVDNSGNAFLVGETFSDSSFPTKNPFQSKPGGSPPPGNNASLDAFVARFNTTLSGSASLIFSSWLGGPMDERGNTIALDGSTNAFVGGEIFWDYANSVNFPTLNALQSVYGGGGSDGFVAKISATGVKLFATYLGAEEDDSVFGIATDLSGNVYLTGQTTSTNFPSTANAIQPRLSAENIYFTPDAFVTKISPAGNNVLYSTYFGGGLEESGSSIAVDRDGYIYVAGQTSTSADPLEQDYPFPITVGTYQSAYGDGRTDAFVAKIAPAVPGLSGLVFSSFLGGNGLGSEEATGIAVDTDANFYVAGFTSSTNYPTTAGAYWTTYRGGNADGFVAKFASSADLSIATVVSPSYVVFGSNMTYSINVNNNGRAVFSGVMMTNTLPPGLQLLSATTTLGSCSTNVPGIVFCNFGQLTNNASALVTIMVKTIAPATVTNTAVLTSVETAAGLELNIGNNTSSTITAIRGVSDMTLAVSAMPEPVLVTSNLTYNIGVTNKGPHTANSVIVTSALPASVSVVSVASTQCLASWATNLPITVSCNCGSLTNGQGAAITLVVRPTAVGTVTNRTGASALELDTSPGNNTNRLLSTVIPAADLTLAQSAAPNPVYVGSNLTYTLTITNRGPSTAATVVLTDPLPVGVVFVTNFSSQGTITQSAGVVTCNLGAIAAGGAATATIVVRPGTAGLLNNAASVTNATAVDANLADNTASTVVAAISTGSPSDPYLKISRAGTNVVLYWSVNAVGYNLYSKASLQSGTWSIVTNTPVVVGDQYYVTNSITNPGRHYRLMKILGPNLTAVAAGSSIVISWTTNATDYALQSSTNLSAGGIWVNMTNEVVVNGDQYVVNDPPTALRKFYRLSRPIY